MPINEKSAEQIEYDRQVELEDQAHWDAVEEAKRVHELELEQGRHQRDIDIAKLETAPSRQKAIERVIVAIVKLPAVIIIATLIPLLLLFKREVPESLSNFLDV